MNFKVPTKKLVDPARLAAFAAGAEPGVVKEQRIPAFPLRLTASELARLKRIAATTPDSMHAFCLRAIQRAMDDAGF